MTSASVNNAGLDASIIPAAVKTVSSQNMQKGQDFGKIMDQAAGKTKKDNTFEVKQEVKADTSKPKKTDMDQKPVADNNTVQEKPEQKPIQEETTVDEFAFWAPSYSPDARFTQATFAFLDMK